MIIYKKIESYLISNIKNNKKVWIIDKNIFNLWEQRINNIINNDKYYIVESTEDNKSIESYQNIMNFLFENNIDRGYTIFGIGGGIVGDMTGFVASTYLRGIKLIHVPTTLLSMVDSSIGGKTGVNNIYGKNMIGSIYQAQDIVIDTSWLETLPDVHKINGMAEVIKMAIIKGGKLYNLVNNSDPIDWNNLKEIIKLSANYKLEIIEDDYRDMTGSRELLNLGHTWGHAYELSQNILHGFAVADGIIEEMKYTNYYYNFPSLSVMKDILDLLKKWKLVDHKKKLSLNRFDKDHGSKLLYFYMLKDKKENRLVTLKNIGNPEIVTWDIDKWKFIDSRYFKINNKSLNLKINKKLKVPSSKSITNRSLLLGMIASSFSNKNMIISDILKSEDTELMLSALQQSGINCKENNNDVTIYPSLFKPTGIYYLGNSGTSVRFLLPLLSIFAKEEIVIDGSEDMRKRPIGPLVKSLIDFGCNIEDKEYLPLTIKPSNNFTKNNITIDGTLSSQYITGLIIAFSMLKAKNKNIDYTINIDGEETSCGFIKMTLDMLPNFGIKTKSSKKEIVITKINNCQDKYNVEGDATTASYLFGWSYLKKFKLEIPNLKLNSVQPDMKVLVNMLKYFGILSEKLDCLMFEPFENVKLDKYIFDLDSSDTFLTWACLFILENKMVEISNIKNQNWKECARIDKFIENIEKLGALCEKTEDGFRIVKGISKLENNKVMQTYNDHRLAMSFSLISIRYNNVLIKNPHCVNKTYPRYWEDLKDININIIPKNNYKLKTITLIGMPGSGKTILGKEAAEKLTIKSMDIDNLIITDIGPIKNFIKNNSWTSFREIESKHIFESLLDEDLNIISTGGGAIENKNSRNLIEDSLVIWIQRKFDNNITTNRTLSDDYKNLEIKRENIYNSLADYIYVNDKTPYDFVKWLRLVLFENPIPLNSTFLCKSNSKYEANISNCIEIRGDMGDNFNLNKIQEIMINFGKPCIYTLRTNNEGGKFKYNRDEYIKINKKAIRLGATFVDLEVDTNVKLLEDIKTIGSIHSNNLDYIRNNIIKYNNDILKIVTSSNNCKILENEIKTSNKILIDNDTGTYRATNNYLTPISSIISEQTAPNQLNYIEYLDKCYKIRNERFIFLFGNNIGESPSSFIHNMVISKYHKNISYLNFETQKIDNVINIIKKPYFIGASVTMPYKEDVISYFKNNNNFKAINTIVKRNIVEFNNTDTMALKYYMKDLPTIILGTGGAAIGAIEASINKDITVIGRNKEKLLLIFNKYKVKTLLFENFKKIDTCYQVINCLPPTVPIDYYLSDNSILIDMTYGLHNYNKTNIVSGYDVLFLQAAYQYIEWFGDDIKFEEIFNEYKNAISVFLNKKYKKYK